MEGCGAGDEGIEVEGFGQFGKDGVEHVVFFGFELEELLFAGDDDLFDVQGLVVGDTLHLERKAYGCEEIDRSYCFVGQEIIEEASDVAILLYVMSV